ncbi:MAG: Gfo/Idh/MocA family oxidoreductase [Opitutaceae bacterium]|jgi:predicted dehydrogenase|nr:Gfo/Idh/MocA family oxidoreductase [Opitutaceae bacterium]
MSLIDSSLLTRRTLLKRGALVAGAGLAGQLSPSAWANPIGANDRIRIGIIGLGSKGSQHLRTISEMAGVQITALCDVDPRQLEAAKASLEAAAGSVYTTTDLRKVMDRSDVDAVLIATSTHWHALATIWACEAGKDVYVEKPVGRTIAEGRKVMAATTRYKRIVQTGTQLRSDSDNDEITAYIRSGKLGRIQWIHGVSYKTRTPLIQRTPWYPDWLDYDLFCGPTPMVPLEREKLHYDWHWRWNTGNGDLVNMGIHAIDLTRRFLGDDAMPKRMMSLGGRYAVDDVGDQPNTQFTVMDFGNVPVFYENRNLPIKPGATYADQFRGQRIGLVVQCEAGYYAGYMGGSIFDNDGNRLLRKAVDVDSVKAHLQNFFDCVRSRRAQDLAASAEIGHHSAQFCHYGNLSYRVGQQASADQIDASLATVSGAPEAMGRMRTHLGAHQVDLAAQPMTLGPWLELDPQRDAITGIDGGSQADLNRARYYIDEVERPGYQMG